MDEDTFHNSWRYDETLELLKDVAKILETSLKEATVSRYSSASLSPSTSRSESWYNEEVYFKEDSDENDGTYVVSTKSINSINDITEDTCGKLLFPYVEPFIERVRLIKEKGLNRDFDAFWISWSTLNSELESIEEAKTNNIAFVNDNYLFMILPEKPHLRSSEQSLVIDECDVESLENSIKITAEIFVDSLMKEAIQRSNELLFAAQRNDNSQQVCVSQHSNKDNSQRVVNYILPNDDDACSNNDVPFCDSSCFDSQQKRTENQNDLMPAEFKLLMEDIKLAKSKRHARESSVNGGANGMFVTDDGHITKSRTKVVVRGDQGNQNKEMIFVKESKEVTDGCGVIVGAEERFVDTVRVGISNAVSDHRDGPLQNTTTINTQSCDSVNADARCVNSFHRTVRSSECASESQVEVQCHRSADFTDAGVSDIKVPKMKDLDEFATQKIEENFNKDCDDVGSNVYGDVNGEKNICAKEKCRLVECKKVSEVSAAFQQNNNETSNKSSVKNYQLMLNGVVNIEAEESVVDESKSENANVLELNNVRDVTENGEISRAIDEEIPRDKDVSFKKVNGGENLGVFHAPVRKLMSRSRKCIRAGSRREARRRVALIRRSDGTPQPSTKKPPSCAGCLLLRVAPSGPFLLLDLSTTESKSGKTFTNKLLSCGQVCPCNRINPCGASVHQTNDVKDNEPSSESLQVKNFGAEKSVSSKESENAPFKCLSNTYYEKQIPVSLINLKNKFSDQSDLQNNLLQSSDCLRVRLCDSSFRSKLSNGVEGEVKDFFTKEADDGSEDTLSALGDGKLKDDTNSKNKNCNLTTSDIKDTNLSISNTKSPKDVSEKSNESLDFLTSRVLNSFEVSSRLKRLEEKLRSSLESLKDTSDDNTLDKNIKLPQDNILYSDESQFVEKQLNVDTQENNVNKTSNKQQIDLYRDSIQNNLCEFLKIHKDLKIIESCTQNNNSEESSCPTKSLLQERTLLPNNNEYIHKKENSNEFSTDADSELTSDAESKELEEFERQERWASNEEYFSLNASIFSSSSCQFSVNDVTNIDIGLDEPLKCYDELLDSSESLSSADEETVANTIANGNMRGEGPATDRRHNKDAANLKSLLKKTTRKGKKNRVIFNENKNEFFEADYIILIREECQYDEENDEGVCTCSQHEMVRLSCCEEDCNGCEQDGCNQEGEPVTLSPPEGYKDSGLFNKDGTFKEQSLFNKDGTLRDQGLYAHPGGLLVGESSGTVFSPQHLQQLQLIQRLQREQLRRAKAALDGSTVPPDEGLEDRVEDDDPEEEITLLQPKTTYAKEIIAGEERPKVNSGQQTTPIDDVQLIPESDRRKTNDHDRWKEEMADEGRSEQISTHQSSPMRLGGILKGGRLWKASGENDQVEELTNCRDSASDEEGRINRAVRFTEPAPSQCGSSSVDESSENQDTAESPKPELTLFRIGSHLLSNNTQRPNSAVRQLFPGGQHYITARTEADKQYLVTSESLRAFEEGKRSTLPTNYRDEDLTVRRTIDRNTLRRSLVKVEAKKKPLSKNDTSLTERIKMLTCNIDEEEPTIDTSNDNEKYSPSTEETLAPVQLPTKCFSPSSSSSSASSCSSTSSTYKKLTDIFPRRQERIPEINEEGNGVVIIPQSDKIISSSTQSKQTSVQEMNEFTLNELNSHDQPAPDVLAGTPGAGDGDELVRFVQQESARTERLRKKYNQQTSTENSDDDDQDDYGFSDRPTVRGIKPHFGSTNEILQQMQTQMMPQQQQPPSRPGHISWPYYSESNLTMPAPHEHTLHHNVEQSANRSMDDYHQQAAIRLRERLAMQGQREVHTPRHHEQHHENIYQNCMTYVNVRCNGNERDLYTDQQHLGHLHTYSRQHRRPESPPPIRTYHQTMVLLPYANLPHQPHYSNTLVERNYHNIPGDQSSLNEYPTLSYPKQKDQMLHMKQGQQVNIPYQAGIPMQLKCSAPMAHIRTVQPRPMGQQMICYSEKVKAPLYQAAPGSPGVATAVSGNLRGVPEGAPAPAASPTAPQNQPHQHNSLYYAMNV